MKQACGFVLGLMATLWLLMLLLAMAGCQALARTDAELMADLREAVRIEMRTAIDTEIKPQLAAAVGIGNRLDQMEQTIGNVGRDVQQNDPSFMIWGVVAQMFATLVICGGGMIVTNRTVRTVVKEAVCRWQPSCAETRNPKPTDSEVRSDS